MPVVLCRGLRGDLSDAVWALDLRHRRRRRVGALILGIIQTLITFDGTLNSWWTRIAVGVLVLIFLLLQRAVSSLSRPAKAQTMGA